MRTIIFSIAFSLVSFISFGKSAGTSYHFNDNFVMTGTDTIFCENVQVDETHISVVKPNGVKVVNSFEDVVMYKKDGKIFKKLPTVVEGKVDTKRKPVFMELVAHKNNMDLMKVLTYESSQDAVVSKFYIYENNKFILELNDKNQNFLINYFLNLKD